MTWFFGIIVVLAIGATVLLASGKLGEMPTLPDDHPVPRLPEGDFDAASLDAVHFATSLRGYSKKEVKDFLKEVSLSLEAGPASADALPAREVRESVFTVVTGGYLMSQVDLVLERIARQFELAQQPDDGSQDDASVSVSDLDETASHATVDEDSTHAESVPARPVVAGVGTSESSEVTEDSQQ